MCVADISETFTGTFEEYGHILETLEHWKDEYGRQGQLEAIRQHAFCLTLRYTGQRLSDVSMFGPQSLVEEKGKWFLWLTQIKTGKFVKIPVPVKLVERLQALPLRGELQQPLVVKTNKRTIDFGAQFWFWSGKGDIQNNAKAWSDAIASVLKRCESEFGKFRYHSTPHTFRHFFAITMLSNGATMEQVAKWLGHSSPIITARHYSHANADWHTNSHAAYMKILDAIEGAPRQAKVVQIGAR